MTSSDELVNDAVRVLRELPVDIQGRAARAILNYAAGDDELTPVR